MTFLEGGFMTKCLQIDPRISPKARGFWLKEPSAKIHFENHLQQTKDFRKTKQITNIFIFRENGYLCYAFFKFFFFGICLRLPPALPGALGGARTAKHPVLNCTCELPVQTLGSPPHDYGRWRHSVVSSIADPIQHDTCC